VEQFNAARRRYSALAGKPSAFGFWGEEINRDDDISIILVEQNSRMALKISNRAYALETGRIGLTGQSADLLHDDQVRQLYLGG
jgi:ABC-type branched-subunit amino acid transport system ATPase component